ncbi:MAG: hypothetical protein L0G27_03835 [Paracoccus sp. (in: a-proteobacteria)]|nr:hypothetical protein [Paracoccus sp. (in: a-proteobacteria)]
MPLSDPDPFQLVPARIHEVEGAGRHAFAIFQAARHVGPVFWVRPSRDAGTFLPAGLPDGLAPRLYQVRARSEVDLLWAVEETLRAPLTGFVLAEPQRPLSLTAGRRLQLAAEAGRTTGLMLIGNGAGSNATESRWQCAPVGIAGCDAPTHHWTLIKNKRGLLGDWMVEWGPLDANPRPVCAKAR